MLKPLNKRRGRRQGVRATWRSLPLHVVILELVEMKGGSLTDRELYESVRAVYDISYTEMLKALMKLELQGKLKVSTAKEGTLIVELLQNK